jgi:tetratricopeptide (TPR) repeat protein
MMRKVELQPRNESFLSDFRIAEPSFTATDLTYSSLRPIWASLASRKYEEARTLCKTAMQEMRIFPQDERAALKLALATAELHLGATDQAKRLAGRSLDLCPNQSAAHRLLLTIYVARKDFAAAYLHLANLPTMRSAVSWDGPLSQKETHIALASWAWQLGEWDQVADHLEVAYPMGLAEMPPEIREDWFKLALYRGLAEDAAAAAASLLDERSVDGADEILQTIVQSGWGKQALPLYRSIYTKQPENELLRRRLVALCVKEGNLTEARELTRPGALKLAA